MEPHHHHEHSHRLTSLNKAFIIGIALNITFVIVEFGVGFYYNSLGLLSDAGHNLGDVASLVLAMLAFRLEKVHPNSRYTYGYKKSTILVSLLNAVILLIAVGIIIAESIDKLFHPVSVDGSAIAWTAGVGVVINALTAWLFMKDKDKDLNVKGAYLHMAADTLVSVGVVASGIIITYTGWSIIDPIIGLGIAVIIIVSTWGLLHDSLRLSLDGVPVGGYEIAVKEGGARSIMSTYGPVNGIWTAGNYDLLTTILRGEWNYDGFVMTDWWAMSNREGYEATKTTHAPMVSAGNDVFMVCTDCSDMGQDDVKEALENGEITRGDLQRNAMNVLHFILGTPSILRFLDRISEEEKEAQEQMGDNDFVAADLVTYEADPATGDVVIDASAWNTKKGNSEVCGVTILADKMGTYDIEIEMKSDLEDLAQLPVTVYIDNIVKTMISIRGTKGEWIKETRDLGFFFGPNHYLKLYFGANGLELGKIRLKLREGMEVLSKHEE